jgi:hypothetical protein
MDPDLDPGGSKTSGSESPTLLKRPGSLCKDLYSAVGKKPYPKRQKSKKMYFY